MNDRVANPVEVQERFVALNLSDSLLLGIQIRRQQGATFDDVHLELGLITGEHADQWVPGSMTFLGCVSAQLDIDIWAKRHCADMIADATCRRDREYADALAPEDPKRSQWLSLNDILLFEITLVQPSGTLRIHARDFELTKVARGR